MSDEKKLPPGIPQDALPSEEFMKTIERLEGPVTDPAEKQALDAHKQEMESRLSSLQPPPIVPSPIVLTYRYTGTCPDCNKEVSTLELDIKDTHAVVAYCANCNKQLQSREEKDLKNE